jgi:hypothetical protein
MKRRGTVRIRFVTVVAVVSALLGASFSLGQRSVPGRAAVAPLTTSALLSAVIRDACLPGVSLNGVNLEGATLDRINLRGAELSGANLRGARISATDFTGAWLDGADLEGAVYDPQTRWPEGFDPDALGARREEVDRVEGQDSRSGGEDDDEAECGC